MFLWRLWKGGGPGSRAFEDVVGVAKAAVICQRSIWVFPGTQQPPVEVQQVIQPKEKKTKKHLSGFNYNLLRKLPVGKTDRLV